MTIASSSGTMQTSTKSQGVAHAAKVGVLFGVVASLMMAGYAMIASATYQHHGFFTPLYHIASTFIAPTSMMTSMQHSMAGSTFYFGLGPALLGALIHMMIGAMYGAAFAIVVARLRLRRPMLIAAGAIWGVVVFAISSFIGLPIAAKIFDSGDQITHMAKMVGYATFLIEHVIFGLTLSMLMTTRPTAEANH